MTVPNSTTTIATRHTSDDGVTAVEPEPPIGRLTVDIIEEAGDWRAFGAIDALIAPLIGAVARHPALRALLPAEACLALGDDAFVRDLNRTFRSIDKPTNVLSFPAPAAQPGFANPSAPRSLGDIALALETVLREAAEQTIAPADHVRHLVLHGVLHLMGYDHETGADAHLMEALEIELLAQIGVANPYAGEAATQP